MSPLTRFACSGVGRVSLLMTLAVCLSVGALAQNRSWPSEAPPRPLPARPVNFPPYELKTMPNGLKVVVVSHHEQPAVSIRLIVRAGAAMDPKGKLGLAMLTASLLDQGAGKRTTQEIADTIDFAGGILATGAGTDLTYVRTIVMKDGLALGLQLMADVVRRPTFAPEEIERQRQQAISSLKVAAEDPDSLASQVIDRLIYGFHPYGLPGSGTAESLAALRRQDFVDFHQQFYVPNNTLLAIVGDVTTEEAMTGVQQAFGDWVSREVPPFKPIEPPPPTKRVVIIDKRDAVQTEIRVGQLGIPRKHDDFVALDQAVTILGGEGANRLQQVLRSQRGLTYGASADLDSYKTAGGIVAETDTRTSGTAETLRVTVDEFSRLQREQVSEGELGGAQNYAVGHFPLTIETPDAIATQVLNYLFYELPLEELPKYRERILSVTTEDIQRAARNYFRPDRLAVVLVGNADEFIKDLRGVGFSDFERVPMDQVDLLSPDLKKASRSGGAGQAAEAGRYGGAGLVAAGGAGRVGWAGRGLIGFFPHPSYQTNQTNQTNPTDPTAAAALLKRAIDGRGGLPALEKMTRFVANAETTLTTQDGKVTAKTRTSVEYPARMRVEAELPGVQLVQVYTDGSGWMQDPAGTRDAPSEMLAEFSAAMKRDVRTLLLGAARGTLRATVLPEEGSEGRVLKVLELSGDDLSPVRLYVDAQSGAIAKIAYETRSPGPRLTEEVFSDYRMVDGVSIPFKATMRRGGVPLVERQITAVELNPDIKPEVFAKPR
jgi:zinc protease